MDHEVRADHHTGLYVGHVGMIVNGCYIHYGYVYSCNFIVVIITCMIHAN